MGQDVLLYLNANEGGDTIVNFIAVDDTIRISAAGFGGGLVAGEALVAGDTFISNTAPTAPTNQGTFLYDTNDQNLFWDVDGSGAQAAVQIAHFNTAVNLTANDFDVVA